MPTCNTVHPRDCFQPVIRSSRFDRFDIDLCSRADESLKQACAELQLSVDQVLEKLSDAAANEPGAEPADLASYSMSRLIQHIVRTHHQYVRCELPRLVEMAHKLTGKHGESCARIEEDRRLLDDLHAEMFAHLQKEEQVLFPFIAQMEQETVGFAFHLHTPASRSVAQPVSMMVREHESADHISMSRLRRLTNDFKPPAWACRHIYRALCRACAVRARSAATCASRRRHSVSTRNRDGIRVESTEVNHGYAIADRSKRRLSRTQPIRCKPSLLAND